MTSVRDVTYDLLRRHGATPRRTKILLDTPLARSVAIDLSVDVIEQDLRLVPVVVTCLKEER